MPIRIPDALPAAAQLESENIFVMTEYRALHQDIRPLRVLILNLMPTKIATETQIMRKLSNTPLQVEVDLLRTKTHEATHVSAGHLETFYRTFDDIRDIHYDGLIITGAPVEQMPFEEVDYWSELCQIMDWSTTHVHSTLHICWGAQAGLYHHYGIQKCDLPAKASGVFEHYLVKPQSPLVRGFDDRFYAVHSRNTDVRRDIGLRRQSCRNAVGGMLCTGLLCHGVGLMDRGKTFLHHIPVQVTFRRHGRHLCKGLLDFLFRREIPESGRSSSQYKYNRGGCGYAVKPRRKKKRPPAFCGNR